MTVRERFLPEMALPLPHGRGSVLLEFLSLQTCHHRLRAVKQFSRWLNRDGRIREDVLSHLTGYNASADRRHERRPLTAEELQVLPGVTEHAPTGRRMTGLDWPILYRVAMDTGFRVSELRSLTPWSFRLTDDPPAVVLRAAHSKHRRNDVQPIRRDLAELLRSWLDGKPTDAPMFDAMPDKTALMLRVDLRRAPARWIRKATDPAERRERRVLTFLAVTDDRGRVVDFHAPRMTYITAGQGRCVGQGGPRACETRRPEIDDERVQPVGHPRLGGRVGPLAGSF